MKTLEQIVGRRKCSISEGFPGTCTNWFGLALTQWTFVGRPIGGRADEKRKKQQFKPLGRGELNWPDIFAAGDEAGIEWYVYEQDSGEGSPFDYTQASYEFLVKHMK